MTYYIIKINNFYDNSKIKYYIITGKKKIENSIIESIAMCGLNNWTNTTTCDDLIPNKINKNQYCVRFLNNISINTIFTKSDLFNTNIDIDNYIYNIEFLYVIDNYSIRDPTIEELNGNLNCTNELSFEILIKHLRTILCSLEEKGIRFNGHSSKYKELTLFKKSLYSKYIELLL